MDEIRHGNPQEPAAGAQVMSNETLRVPVQSYGHTTESAPRERSPSPASNIAHDSGTTPLLDRQAETSAQRSQVDNYFNVQSSVQAPVRRRPVPAASNRPQPESSVQEHSAEGAFESREGGRALTESEYYKPIPPPPDAAALEFKPTVLRPYTAIALMTLYLAVGAGISVLWWRSGVTHLFHVSSENVQLVAQYVPTVLGTITVQLFITTLEETMRMKPFVSMADQGHNDLRPRGASASHSVAGQFLRWQSRYGFFGTPISWISILTFFTSTVAGFLVPFKASLLATHQVEDGWNVTLRTQPAKYLLAAYSVMTLHTLTVTIWLWNSSTGLRWDPVSIADFAALFANCNAMKYFGGIELAHKMRASQVLRNFGGRFRIGYWQRCRANSDETETSYGIGVLQTGQAEPVDHGIRRPSAPEAGLSEGSCDNDHQACEHYPFRTSPMMPRWMLVFWTTVIYISLAGFIYLAARRYIFKGFKLPNDWGTGVADVTLLYYSLLFRSLPTLLANYFVVFCIRPIDSNMRFIQPFVNMFEIPGSATNTILLAYSTMAPLEVPLKAYDNGHYKVCWYSALSTASPLFPIFVGGLLTMTSLDNDVHFQFSLPAVIGITVFLLVYCISLPIAWPQMHRLLPRQFWSMADLMAMCHQSHFLKSADLRISDPKMSKERMNARFLLDESKFLFGVYEGLDGKKHVGFDVVSTDEEDLSVGTVQWIRPTRSRIHRFYWRFSLRGRQHVRKQSRAADTEMAHLDRASRPGHHRTTSGVDLGVDAEDEEARSSAVDERYMASGAL